MRLTYSDVMKMMAKIGIEFLGVLAGLAERSTVSLELQSPIAVGDVISELVNRFSQEFKRALIDPELNDPRPNVLIILNRKEISALNGLETAVKDGDKLVLLPVSHGG